MKKKKAGKTFVFFVCFLVSIGIFAYACWNLAVYYIHYGQETDLKNEIENIRQGAAKAQNEASAAPQTSQEEYDTIIEDTYRKQYEALKAVNEEYVAWLTIEDTTISYPILQGDNEYYLKHNIKKEKDAHGSIFLDEGCVKDGLSWLIHGHHMKDGTMFAPLKKYEKKDYIQDHKSIFLDTKEGRLVYIVYAVALIDFTSPEEQVFHYENIPFRDEEITGYNEKLQANAVWYDESIAQEKGNKNSTANEKEKLVEDSVCPDILILSTCEYHSAMQRLIIVARRERQ